MVKGSDFVNEAAPFVMEYVSRQRLAKLGFMDDLNELDCLTADALLLIDAEVHAAQADLLKKKIPGG